MSRGCPSQMMRFVWSCTLLLAFCMVAVPLPAAEGQVDLIITDATVFDALSGGTLANRMIVIEGGRILSVWTASEAKPVDARETIAADGRLVTPGFVDVHHHTGSILGDSVTSGGGPG